MQHAHQQDQIRARPQRQIQIGVARNRRHARIGDNQFRAVVASAPDIIGSDRRAFTYVGSDGKDDVRLGDVTPGNRTSIDVERELVSCSGGDHAEPAVVVDVAGP